MNDGTPAWKVAAALGMRWFSASDLTVGLRDGPGQKIAIAT